MKSCFRHCLLAVLVSCCDLVSPVSAQTFTTIHNFAGVDGASPYAGLLLSGTTLFGTTRSGGSFGLGTVFALNFDGTDFTNLYSFTGGLDGDNPAAGLILCSNILYGTTTGGGGSTNGTVFAIHADGTGFTTLHSFSALNNSTNSDGANPRAGLILSSNMLFGVTEFGGVFGAGAVFALHTDGMGFTNLHSFSATSGSNYTNSDGAYPIAGLVSSGNILYGNAYQGCSSGNGTVYAINTDGTGFTNLHIFTEGIGSWPTIVNSDGANPAGGLIISSNALFGVSYTGGSGGAGTVFTIGLDGTGFTNLYNFTAVGYSRLISDFTNEDGAGPADGLILSGNTLYGATFGAGVLGAGTMFALKDNGANFTILHGLNGTNEGAGPLGGLVLSGNTLFGNTIYGGTNNDNGTIFSISLPIPQLTITFSPQGIVLTWPADSGGFTLQSTTNLTSPGWDTNLPAPVIINGQYTVTNPISGTQQYFRLSQ